MDTASANRNLSSWCQFKGQWSYDTRDNFAQLYLLGSADHDTGKSNQDVLQILDAVEFKTISVGVGSMDIHGYWAVRSCDEGAKIEVAHVAIFIMASVWWLVDKCVRGSSIAQNSE